MQCKQAMAILLTAGTTAGCQQNLMPAGSFSAAAMEAIVQRNVFYKDLPSASGIEAAGTGYYVIGDDSPYLYLLNADYQVVEKTVLFDTATFATGRIPKAAKADLESITQVKYKNEDYLLLFGSGATAARNKAYVVQQANPQQVREVDITAFYTFLQAILARREPTEELNIEGLAADNTHLYLLQRSIAAGVNTIFRFENEALVQHLMEAGELPAAATFYFSLPQLGPYEAGFSGACIFEDKLFFSASLEATLNAVDDGEVLGSFVGFIPLETLSQAGNAAAPLIVAAATLKNTDGSLYLGKAESIIVKAGQKQPGYHLILVSDDDKGHSELLEVWLRPNH